MLLGLQTVVGSIPHADGNFDRTNNFTSVITEGVSNMTTAMANDLAGQVAYVIPASKGTFAHHMKIGLLPSLLMPPSCMKD